MDGYNPWKFFNDNRELLSSRQSQHCVTVRYEQRRFCGKLIQPPGFDGLQPLRNSGLQLPRTGSFLAKNVGDIINFQPKYQNTHWCRYPGGLWCRILKCHDRKPHWALEDDAGKGASPMGMRAALGQSGHVYSVAILRGARVEADLMRIGEWRLFLKFSRP